MKKTPLVVSYYTKNSIYEREVEGLIASCKKLGLEYDIAAISCLGSWEANCSYKPKFLLEKMEEHDRPLIWTDADSEFATQPHILLSCQADVALRINDYASFDDPNKFFTGTFFVKNTLSAKKLLELWNKECERNLKRDPRFWDQEGLKKVLLHYPTIVEIKRLPIGYMHIVGTPVKENQEIIVKHYQASRVSRKIAEGEIPKELFEGLPGASLKSIHAPQE